MTLAAILMLSACKPKPTEAQLRAMDEKAIADAENAIINDTMNSTGLNRQQAEEKQVNDWKTERAINEAKSISPEEAKLLDDYDKHPKETVDRLCDEVTKDGC